MKRLLLLAVLLCAPACVRVKPWQRETLAAPALRSPPWPAVQRSEVHVFEIREGSTGGYGSAGGGCGCN